MQTRQGSDLDLPRKMVDRFKEVLVSPWFTLYCVGEVEEVPPAQLDRGVLVRVLDVRAARQALAVRLGGAAVVEGRLLHDDDGLVHAVGLLGRADGRRVGVAGHVEGDAPAVLRIIIVVKVGGIVGKGPVPVLF